MTAPFTVVIFDIDGTLLDSTAAHHASLTSALASFGLDPHVKPWGAYRHYTDSGVFDELCAMTHGVGASAMQLSALDDACRQRYCAEAALRPVNEIAGAGVLLEAVRRDPSMVMTFATGSMRGSASEKLKALGLKAEAELLATGSDALSRRDIVMYAVEQAIAQVSSIVAADLPASLAAEAFVSSTASPSTSSSASASAEIQWVILGDGKWDEVTAVALGIPFIGVQTGLYVFGDLPQRVVSDLTTLDTAQLKQLARPCPQLFVDCQHG